MDKIRILQKINKNKDFRFDFSEARNDKSIIRVEKENSQKTRYINLSQNGQDNGLRCEKDYVFIPLFLKPNQNEGVIWYLTNKKGTGKSLLTSLLANDYKTRYKNKIFLFCPTKSKDDLNFKHITFQEEYKPDDMEELEETDFLNKFSNSLCIFDDIDNYMVGKKSYKRVFNEAVQNGRKLNINIIYISHSNSNARFSKIDTECDVYLTTYDNLQNNRFLNNYLRSAEKDDLRDELKNFNKTDTYICINLNFNIVFSDRLISKFGDKQKIQNFSDMHSDYEYRPIL